MIQLMKNPRFKHAEQKIGWTLQVKPLLAAALQSVEGQPVLLQIDSHGVNS